MKKPLLTSVGSAAVLALALSSCGAGGQSTGPRPPDAESSPETTAAAEPDQTTETSEAPSKPSLSAPAAGPVDAVGSTHGADFSTYTDDAVAITYDTALVPEAATIVVERLMGPDGSSFALEVAGLEPEYAFGAHVHMDTCGETGEDAGARYEHEPSGENPADATPVNPDDELWLSLATEAQGQAEASTTVGWSPRPGEGHSLVLHDQGPTADGKPGQPGERVACFVLGIS